MYEQIIKGGPPDAARRACDDCRHMKAALSWWCTNKAACDARGTSIPGVHSCTFWEPARRYEDLTWWEKHFSGSYMVFKAEPAQPKTV
jgi:hypothetical protein